MSEKIKSIVPEGFQTLAPTENAIWWQKNPGDVIYGRLLARFPRAKSRKKDAFFYQIKVGPYEKLASLLGVAVDKIQILQGVRSGDEEKEIIKIKPGDIINVDESKALEVLSGYSESDGVFDVFIQCVEKVELDSGNDFWRIIPSVKTIKASSRPIEHKSRVVIDENETFPTT